MLGKHHTKESNEKNRLSHLGKSIPLTQSEKSPFWKGDSVGIEALHDWVRKYLPQPERCQFCNVNPSVDLANITGNYARDFYNWRYLCRKCHNGYDRMRRLKK